MPAAPVIYLAGPEVFLPDAVDIGRRKVAVCARHGLDGWYPLDADLGPVAPEDPDRAWALFDAMVDKLDVCAGVIANLTPFRGPSADVGTVWELGYAAGRGLPVFAYTGALAHYGARVTADGLDIEDFDLADNLMLEGAVRRHGGEIVRVDAGADAVAALRHLDGFEIAVRRAAAHFGLPG
jgi:nucleoside 2-deoxyribosyltransferase